MTRPTLLLLALLLSLGATAQFTISNTEFPQAMQAWEQYRYYAVFPLIFAGPAGPNQTYNFTSVGIYALDTLSYVDADSTPFAAQHPNAQLATVAGSNVFYYFSQSANAFWENGLSIIGDFGNGLDTIHGNHIAPALVDTLLSDQYSYGYSETEVSVDTVHVNANVDVHLWEIKSINVDGWGLLETPLNIYDTVLRVRTVTDRIDSVFVNNLFDSETTDIIRTLDYYNQGTRHPVMRVYVNGINVIQDIEILGPQLIYGCTDPGAGNFNPNAAFDDGSCVYCPAIAYNITSDTAICPGDSATLTINGGVIWGWSTGDSTNVITVAPDSDMVYSVIFADSAPCYQQASVLVEVDYPVTADFWTDEPWTPITDSVQFVNLSQEADQYFWDFDDNAATSTLENPKHLFTTTGLKNIMLIASNSCSVDTFYMQLDVAPTGIEPVTNDVAELEVYPNPSTEDATIAVNLKTAADVSLSIYNLMGQQAGTSPTRYLQRGSHAFSVNELAPAIPSGIYFISVGVMGQTYLKKWIKL